MQVPSHYLIPLIRLEVLDPKMDQGFGEDVEDEYDVSRPLLPTEVIGIMDQILCLEVCQNYNTKYHAARRLRSDRLAGILASPSHKRCLRQSTSTESYGLSLGHSTRPNSIQQGTQ